MAAAAGTASSDGIEGDVLHDAALQKVVFFPCNIVWISRSNLGVGSLMIHHVFKY
jgi:hypothetical protein